MIPVMKALIAAAAMSLAGSLAAAAGERVSDAATGFGLQVPPGFDIRNPRGDANHDILVDIVSESGEPPVAGQSHALCAAGFKRTPPDFDQTLEDLTKDSAMEWMATESRRALQGLGYKVESVDKIDSTAFAGLEFTMIPGTGPDAENIRFYIAIMDRPTGRADVICATTKAAERSATGLFHKIRDGITVSAK